MIHYQLRCSAEHGFDGWFRDSATFEQQAGAGLIACPECGIVAVHRALMAPALTRGRRVVDQAGVDQASVDQAGVDQAVTGPAGGGRGVTPPEPTGVAKAVAVPDQVRAMLQKMRAEIERNCENVGDRFADEARAIHRGETDARGIYGETTPDQAEALADEGIEVARIPWVPRADG